MARTPRNSASPRRPETTVLRAGGSAASFPGSSTGAVGHAPSHGQNDAGGLVDPWNFRLLV